MKKIVSIILTLLMLFSIFPNYTMFTYASELIKISDSMFLPENKLIFDRTLINPDVNISVNNVSTYDTSEITKDLVAGSQMTFERFTTQNSCDPYKLKNGQVTHVVWFNDGVTEETEIIVDYSLVGTYGEKPVGAKLYVTDIIHKPARLSRFDIPAIQFAAELYRGFFIANIESANFLLEIYDIETKEKIELTDTYITFSSLNNYWDSSLANGWNSDIIPNTTACEKVSPLSTIGNAYITQDSNMTSINYNNKTYYYAINNDFEDSLGSPEYNKNSVSFDFYGDINVCMHTELASMWFTFDTSPLTLSEPTPPQKSVDKINAIQGDVLTYTIEQKIHTLGSDTYLKYSTLEIKDTLDPQVEYQNAYLMDENENILNIGSIVYDDSTHVLTYTFNSNYLQNEMEYKGQSYFLKIECLVKDTFENTINNEAITLLNSVEFKSNKVTTNKYHTISTEVINGSIDPSIHNIPTGNTENISYSPNTGYYLESIIVNGESQDINEFKSNYIFENITTDHHIKVIYAPIIMKTLTITKKWVDDSNKYNTRPENLEITLYQNNIEYKTIILSENDIVAEDIWAINIDVPKYDEEGNEYLYTIQENESQLELQNYYYEASTNQETLTVTNTGIWLPPIGSNSTPAYNITISKEIINTQYTIATAQDYENINLNINDTFYFPIALKQLNRILSTTETGMVEYYEGYSGLIYNGILTNKDKLYFTNISAGKYEIAEHNNQYFDFVDFTKISSTNGVTFSQENGKYYIIISGLTGTNENIELKATNKINPDRYYEEAPNKINLFKLKNKWTDQN